MSNQPSLPQIEHGLKIAARIVVLFGETYLPIFNRIHEEIEKMKTNGEKENLALLLAKKYAEME